MATRQFELIYPTRWEILKRNSIDGKTYQQTEYLTDALVAANKPFTMMAYPNRTHSISEGDGTTRHLYSLLTRYLNERLPVNPESPAVVP